MTLLSVGCARSLRVGRLMAGKLMAEAVMMFPLSPRPGPSMRLRLRLSAEAALSHLTWTREAGSGLGVWSRSQLQTNARSVAWQPRGIRGKMGFGANAPLTFVKAFAAERER